MQGDGLGWKVGWQEGGGWERVGGGGEAGGGGGVEGVEGVQIRHCGEAGDGSKGRGECLNKLVSGSKQT